jgi:hypothetical protein
VAFQNSILPYQYDKEYKVTSSIKCPMATQQYKTIKVSQGHYDELAKLGTLQDSFDKVIGRLLENRNQKEAVCID